MQVIWVHNTGDMCTFQTPRGLQEENENVGLAQIGHDPTETCPWAYWEVTAHCLGNSESGNPYWAIRKPRERDQTRTQNRNSKWLGAGWVIWRGLSLLWYLTCGRHSPGRSGSIILHLEEMGEDRDGPPPVQSMQSHWASHLGRSPHHWLLLALNLLLTPLMSRKGCANSFMFEAPQTLRPALE